MVKHYRIDKDKIFPIEKICACIGYFDGMHKGHQALIDQAKSSAQKNACETALICFDPDPFKVIFGYENEHLFPISERERLCEKFDIDILIEIEFDEVLMKMDAESFVNDYLNRMNLVELICGFDFTFGDKGKGNYQDLKKYGNFKTTMIAEKDFYGIKISSSRIKEVLRQGNFRLVRRLLGYDYYFIVKAIKSYPDGDKWLTEAELMDESCVLPKDNTYKNFYIKNSHLFMITDQQYDPDQIFYISTVNE